MKRITLGLLAISGFVAVPAMAADVIDQNASTNTFAIARFTMPGLVQSFQQTAGNISGAGIFLMPTYGSGSGTITIDLWSALPNQDGASKLASGSALAAGPGQWIDVFWNAVSVTPGTTYYLDFTSTNSSLAIAGSNNAYTAGLVYADDRPFPNRQDPLYKPFPNLDYAFRTYADGGATAAVPEPATWAMMLVGFGAMGAAMRRRPERKVRVRFAV